MRPGVREKAVRWPAAEKGSAPSRQRMRTEATRRRLLAAAERIFARDGFDAARVEDIASLAGYTRGAFYANYQSKEDIFFALLEHWVQRRLAEVAALLEKHASPAAQLRALRNHYARGAKDRRLMLLSLEFKLFAVRHPGAHARLRSRERLLRASAGDLLRRVLAAVGRRLPVSSAAAARALGAFSNVLLLENLADSKAVTDSDVRHLLGIFFDAVLGS